MLQPGDPTPDFTLPRDGGGVVTLSDLRPDVVVVYFYPKDDTPGCTKQALGFTEAAQAFADTGATVLGISKDSVTKHEKFRAKHGLSVTLLSDEENDVCERYGTWVEKNMYGRKFMGIERATFVIDGTGQIVRVWRKVKVAGHVAEVLEVVQGL